MGASLRWLMDHDESGAEQRDYRQQPGAQRPHREHQKKGRSV